ncbi:MAG: hypothetical protein K2P52_08450 [Campylobacterales bacterium]|nr:hypothetical protein [Campylobacterales bacterium]
MSIQELLVPNDYHLFADTISVNNINPEIAGNLLNIGMDGLPSRINIANASTPVYINDVLYNSIGASGYTGPTGPTGANGLNGPTGPIGNPTVIGTFGSSPNANGGTIAGNTLTLQPANITNPGGISIANQTIKGVKTFDDGIITWNVAPSSGVNKKLIYFAD